MIGPKISVAKDVKTQQHIPAIGIRIPILVQTDGMVYSRSYDAYKDRGESAKNPIKENYRFTGKIMIEDQVIVDDINLTVIKKGHEILEIWSQNSWSGSESGDVYVVRKEECL